MNREEDMAGYAQQGTATPLAPVTKIKMLVTVTGVAGGVATFTLEGEDAEDKPYVDNGTKTIHVPNGSTDVILRYKLKDDTNSPNQDLDFCTGSPIWVTDQTSCPTTPCDHPEIDLKSVNKKQLEVIDHNSSPGDLRFSLVLDGNSGRVLADPIIKNQP